MSSQSGRATSAQGATVSSADKVKIFTPDLYYGDREKLDAFLMQVELYIRRHETQFKSVEDKVLFTLIYFRGNAFTWFQHYLKDFLGKELGDRENETQIIFNSSQQFEARLRRVFEDIDKKRTAERQLYELRQKGSAVSYSVSFQHIAANTEWDDVALISQFYRGLREEVKDEIVRTDRSENLTKMIIRAVIIDNR